MNKLAQISDNDIVELFKKIDLTEANMIKQIKNINELRLSILQEQVKRSDKFYLARKTKKEIIPIMKKHLFLFIKVYGKKPSWNDGNSVENFWINQRTTWNKAHGLEWNNNTDPNTKQSMEYKH